MEPGSRAARIAYDKWRTTLDDDHEETPPDEPDWCMEWELEMREEKA